MPITVTALRTTPVKALRIRSVDAIELGDHGALGDRAFYLVDEQGAMVNGKRLGRLHSVTADYDRDDEVLGLELPGEAPVSAPIRLGPELTTTFFGVERTARVLDGPWAAALSRVAGCPLRIVEGGAAVDRGAEGAVSLVSRGSLERLAHADEPAAADRRSAGEPVDARRFRMLIEIDGVAAHAEDGWLGRELTVGEARLRMCGHVGRCVTTTRSPDSGEVDLPTLQMLATYRREEATTEPLAFGVHGEVLTGGRIRVGDHVTLGTPVGA